MVMRSAKLDASIRVDAIAEESRLLTSKYVSVTCSLLFCCLTLPSSLFGDALELIESKLCPSRYVPYCGYLYGRITGHVYTSMGNDRSDI